MLSCLVTIEAGGHYSRPLSQCYFLQSKNDYYSAFAYLEIYLTGIYLSANTRFLSLSLSLSRSPSASAEIVCLDSVGN